MWLLKGRYTVSTFKEEVRFGNVQLIAEGCCGVLHPCAGFKFNSYLQLYWEAEVKSSVNFFQDFTILLSTLKESLVHIILGQCLDKPWHRNTTTHTLPDIRYLIIGFVIVCSMSTCTSQSQSSNEVVTWGWKKRPEHLSHRQQNNQMESGPTLLMQLLILQKTYNSEYFGNERLSISLKHQEIKTAKDVFEHQVVLQCLAKWFKGRFYLCICPVGMWRSPLPLAVCGTRAHHPEPALVW